jgi:hypothetical protein
VLADPRYSCAIVVLFDAYCINPPSISGHYFQPALPYLERYVGRDASGRQAHPFFDGTPVLRPEEDLLLKEYNVSYILADPESAHAIDAKLKKASTASVLDFEHAGWRLYRLGAL